MKCSSCNTEIETDSCPACDQKEKDLPYKDPMWALILSIVPGLGLKYAGNPGKGAVILMAVLICLWIPVIGWLLIPILWIGGAVSAYNTATRANAND